MENLETILASISDNVTNAEDVKKLGKELGLERQKIKKYKKRKKVVGKGKYIPKGTREMLVAWAKGKEVVEVVEKLREALEKAGLHQVVEMCLSECSASAQSADETDAATDLETDAATETTPEMQEISLNDKDEILRKETGAARETAPELQEISRDDIGEILRKVANEISESHKDAKKAVKRLGKELGCNSKDIKRYRKANQAAESKSEGALEMLQSWSKEIPSERMPKDLKEALTRAKLEWVANRCIPVERPARNTKVSNLSIERAVENKSWSLGSFRDSLQKALHPNNIEVTICSGSDESSVKVLMEYIADGMKDVVKSVTFKQLPYNIREMNHMSLEGIDVMVLCHSIHNRRFSLTDVTDSLYDKFLKKAREKLGKRRVCVITHDLSSSDIEEARLEARMASLRITQPTVFMHSYLVMIAGDLSVNPPPLNNNQRGELRMFFEQAKPQRGCCACA